MNRKIDELGRLVIPAEIRKQLNINSGDSVNIEVVDNKVIVTNPNEIDYKQIVEEVREYVEKEMFDYLETPGLLDILDKVNNESK